MLSFNTISKTAATLGLTLLAASFAHAQGPASTSGSTDIYNTDFQKTFETVKSNPSAKTAHVTVASTDIYNTDFQKTFSSDSATHKTSTAGLYAGSTDIYSTNFQRAFM